ncbi:MAG: class II fructose-bisphosphate aldolase [bacterium]|nr:class II fructose-bisphosphate aldolase [bacterium]
MKLSQLFQRAQDDGFAIGAFNAGDIVTIKAIIQAAQKLSSPVIIETSPGEAQFLGTRNLSLLIEGYRRETKLPIFINLDHSTSLTVIEEGLKNGFDLIHFDGSKLSWEENIGETLDVVAWSHLNGALVEAETDSITGESKAHGQGVESFQAAGIYTDPDKAAKFTQETGVDVFASFIGNVHGVYKDPIKLDLKRLAMIREKVSCFLSLHGGSGIPEEEIKKVIRIGKVVKINVSTELRLAYRSALEKSLEDPDEAAIYKIMQPAVEAIQKVVESKIKIFGSEGKA